MRIHNGSLGNDLLGHVESGPWGPKWHRCHGRGLSAGSTDAWSPQAGAGCWERPAHHSALGQHLPKQARGNGGSLGVNSSSARKGFCGQITLANMGSNKVGQEAFPQDLSGPLQQSWPLEYPTWGQNMQHFPNLFDHKSLFFPKVSCRLVSSGYPLGNAVPSS